MNNNLNRNSLRIMLLVFLTLVVWWHPLLAQTSGKVAGIVTSDTGDPLVGVNIVLDGTDTGAATDVDGYYVILNVRSGNYSLRSVYVGYRTKVVENIQISADQTTVINIQMAQETIEGQEEVVTAEKPLVEFNQTSSIAIVNTDQIDLLPVQNLDEIINLQAGVVDGHFRGGRIGEVQFQVDGVSINNPYDNSSILELDRSVIQEVQIISGTFDAKYGQAMSGVVNTVLKSGSNTFEWSGEVYGGDYYTTDETRYPNNDQYNPSNIYNLQLTFSGPTFLPGTTFLVSGRQFLDGGWLFGERRFLPTDRSDLETAVFHPTGNGELVEMQSTRERSGQFKISNQSLTNIQISYQAILNDIEGQRYSHAFRLNPDGIKTQTTFALSHGFDWTHTLSDRLFYKLGVRQNIFDFRDFKYEDLYDPRYLEAGIPQGEANYEWGALVQGVDLGRFKQETTGTVGKLDITWQANRSHLLESGVEAQISDISFGSPGYLRPTNINGVEILQPRENIPMEPGVQKYRPLRGAAYVQDRVEWNDLVIRAGGRMDYFDARTTIPGDLRNPANTIEGAPQSVPQPTTVKLSLSPRLGLSFPLSSTSSLYFSYGHFSQMPGLGLLYNNADYSILESIQEGSANYGIVMGNPDLKPEKTIQYEFGFKQALTSFLGWELTTFYKDIRDLLGVEFITTYNVSDYGRFTNVDFGSVYGFTLSLDQRPIGPISTSVDYTLQAARGNSSDPRETANRAEAGKDSRPRDIAFNWDQAHTLNLTAIFAKENNYSISTIVKIGSGQPYTPQIGSGFGADLETNSGRKSSFALVDLRAEKFFTLGPAIGSAFLRAANLLNENFVNGFVFSTTGSPDYTQFPQINISQLIDPSRFYNPRRVEFGLTFRNK